MLIHAVRAMLTVGTAEQSCELHQNLFGSGEVLSNVIFQCYTELEVKIGHQEVALKWPIKCIFICNLGQEAVP